MENPNINTLIDDKKIDSPKPKFQKSDFTISLDSMGDGFEIFVQKSADTLFGLGKKLRISLLLKKQKREVLLK